MKSAITTWLFALAGGEKKRIHSAVIYVWLQNGKIWIEEDWTEEGIAAELLEAGVAKEEIILAFYHPTIRRYSEFAVA